MFVNKEFIRKYIFTSLVITLITIIFLVTVFFKTHFYPGTVINGVVNVSWLTTKAADEKLNNWAASYTLALHERGNIEEQIKGTEIGLKFDRVYGSYSLKKEQNRTLWFISFFNRDVLNIGNVFTYDENLLQERYSKLNCVDNSNVVEPKNATLKYSNGSYYIVKEVYGNKVNDALLYSCIKSAVINGESELDLDKLKCYENPTIKSDSEMVKNTKAVVEHYITSEIIYTYAGGSEVVDENVISNWIEFDTDLNVIINKVKIKDFLKTLAVHYDTCGKVRDFVTSTGTRIKIGGGDYGWKVDVNQETAELIEDIMSRRTIIKEPKYSQKGAFHNGNDIGYTYVEIDLSKQHLWFYNSGILIANGNVVTGDIYDGYKTPEGIYSLKYKVTNTVLKGENYSAIVSYWMPFNNNIGIHDATWRTEFGRDIYLTRGSHGCINVPFWLAEKIYNNISVGTPIICYY